MCLAAVKQGQGFVSPKFEVARVFLYAAHHAWDHGFRSIILDCNCPILFSKLKKCRCYLLPIIAEANSKPAIQSHVRKSVPKFSGGDGGGGRVCFSKEEMEKLKNETTSGLQKTIEMNNIQKDEFWRQMMATFCLSGFFGFNVFAFSIMHSI